MVSSFSLWVIDMKMNHLAVFELGSGNEVLSLRDGKPMRVDYSTSTAIVSDLSIDTSIAAGFKVSFVTTQKTHKNLHEHFYPYRDYCYETESSIEASESLSESV